MVAMDGTATSRPNMEEDSTSLTFFPNENSISDLDHSFTSTTSSSTTFTTTTTTTSARSSLSLPSFHLPPSIHPLPHSSSHPNWSAIRAASALSPDSSLRLRNLSLIRHLGSGNLARVYHCRLRGLHTSDFALKVIDLDKLNSPDLLSHVRAEARVLSSLDHPFLPTLYARLDAGHYACFLIDYCPSGDLHTLLHRLPHRRLPIPSARFYAAEVLLALQYLHALGFVYRDLKPENVLLQADGHVMLSDFDLCFHSPVNPSLIPIPNPNPNPNPNPKSRIGSEQLEFVAEPDTAYSRACVGTHEYIAPEVVAGSGHGNGVDWWAFGVFLYELLYGRTPFKGATKEATLRNIAGGAEVRFPAGGGGRKEAAAARDLIARLLVRDPKRRLGAKLGAAEIMRHPFFDGVKWALIRCSPPPPLSAARGGAAGTRRWEWSRGILGRIGSKLGLGSKTRVKRKKSSV